MAVRAGSWPTTRSRRRASILSSFSTSPSRIRLTGMPVQRLTMAATSDSPTSRRSMALSFGEVAASCFSRAGISPYSRREARSYSPFSLACSSSMRRSSSFFWRPRAPSITFFSFSHWARNLPSSSLSSANSFSISASRVRLAASFSFVRECRSNCSCISRRSRTSISVGRLSSCIRTALAASSMRSTALSGRKRSAM